MGASNEVEIARHDLRIDQLTDELQRLRSELEKDKVERKELKAVVDDILRWGAFARVVFIGAIAVGGFGSWVLGVTDHVRKLFSANN